MKYCAECRAGEVNTPADYLVMVLDDIREEKPRPCRKYICDEHRQMLDMDGSDYRVEKTL